MGYLNDTVPADSDAVKNGAGIIRSLQTQLNTVIAKIFDNTGAFLAKWVTTGQIADNAITTSKIVAAAVTQAKLPAGVLSADSPGRALMAAGYILPAMLDPAFVLPANNVGTTQIAAGAVTTSKVASNAITQALVAAGVAKIAVGTYAGSGSGSVSVTAPGFQPDFILLGKGSAFHSLGLSFFAEAVSGASPLHRFWEGEGDVGLGTLTDSVASTGDTSAIQWQSNGFIVVNPNTVFNFPGRTHVYLALKV